MFKKLFHTNDPKPLFGKADWFKTTNGGLGIHPVAAQGWVFMGTWLSAILLPSLALLWSTKPVEALIWAAFASILLVRESQHLVHEKRRENVFVIGEENDVTKVTTRNYDLELRDQ